jgi:hypothetical protein
VIIRTLDGLRVALAGFPAALPVEVGEGLDLAATTVGELRLLPELSRPVDLIIPYRMLVDSVVTIKAVEWSLKSER